MTAAAAKHLQDYVPALDALGIRNVAGTHQRGLGVQFAQHVIAAGPVLALTFAGLGLRDMADNPYTVIVTNRTTGAVTTPLVGSISTTGFTVAGVALDILAIVVVGQIAGTPAP